MQRTLTLDERSFAVAEPGANSFCLVCDAALSVASSTNIFYTSLAQNGELLASFVLRVLRPVASDLRSSYICTRCNQLFQMLEQAQRTVSNIRCEILKVYHSRESQKLLERKAHLSVGHILADDLFEESEHKIATQSDRFEDIDEFRGMHVESNESGARNASFDDSPNDFCNLNIEIGSERKIEIRESVYESKIDCLKPLEVECGGEVVRRETYDDSANDFGNLNIGIDAGDKKIVKPLEVRQSSVYANKIDCLKTLDVQLDENLARADTFGDSQNNFCNLNIAIDSCDKRNEKPLEIRESSDNGRKIDCLKALRSESEKNLPTSNSFVDSTNDFCNLNSEIDNYDEKIEKPIRIAQNVVYEAKVDCLKVEEPTDDPKEREDERNLENCSRNAQQDLVVNISNDLFDNSIDRAEKPTKDDKRDQYTMRCRMCPRLFRFARHLRAHSLKHGGSRPYFCRKCDERFADLTQANAHVSESHSTKKNCISVATEPPDGEIPDFTGEDCIILVESESNEDSESKRPSKSGRISKYSLKPLKYPCSTCGKKWRTSAELKTHVKSHSNLRPYMCEKCGQAYKHKNALEIHVGMHNGISPYQCNVCNKCFTQKGALMRHLPLHTGEMPYQCELCGKRFVHHTSYNMHALSHTGKKSYQCHVCDLSLLSTSHLKRHMRVHTGEKPYSCDLCGKSFAERYNLFAHQKIHDPAEIMAKAAKKITYKCEQCDEIFDKKQKLDEHTKARHSGATNGSKWIGHTVDVENPAKTTDGLADQSWQDYNYSKLQSVVAGMKNVQNDNALAQISHESIALLMSQANYNKGLAVMIQPTNSTINAEIDRTQI